MATPATSLTSSDETPAPGGTFGALRAYPAFRRLWMAALATSLGQWMQSTALGWLALELTDSTSFVGLVAFAAGIPFLLISIPGGLIIDRFDRRRVLMTCQLSAAFLAICVSIDVLTGFVEPWHLLIFAFLNGSLQAITNPAQQSITPTLVPRERLTNAIALLGAGQNMTRVVGPTIAGAVIGFSSTGVAFILQSAALVVAVTLLASMQLPHAGYSRAAATMSSIFDGIRLVFSRSDLRTMILLASIPTFFVFPYLSFLSVFARDVLEIGPEGLGVLMASSGIGAVAGSLFIASRSSSMSGTFLAIEAIAYGFVIAGFALSPSLLMAMPLLIGAGFLGSSYMSSINALMQHRISDEIRGRVTGVYMLTWGLMPLGAMPMGIISTHIGIPATVAGAALISNLLILVLILSTSELKEL